MWHFFAVLEMKSHKTLVSISMNPSCTSVINSSVLNVEATDIKVTEVDFNPDFIKKMIPKLEWTVICDAADSIGHLDDLPRELVPGYESDEDFLKKAHHVIMEVEIKEGDLICPETGRKFPIKNGIPNMLLKEDEI
ncbi:Multifunctional methyltransferase subunit TRM112-like protein [Lamellibrachia satsuma]|nr:Multifunctional methyltransferase subunit TRM112-like protein [Lamellibrachia satsuma]